MSIDATQVARTQPGLLARYDTRVLRPPAAAATWSSTPSAVACLGALRRWCLAGAVPRTTVTLAVACLQGEASATQSVATQLSLDLDGSLQMQALGSAGRIALRLKTKLHELMPSRPRQPDDPWDAGTLITSAEGLQALASFRPRRPTLIVVDSGDVTPLNAMLATLQDGHAAYAWPVRVLVLGAVDVAAPSDAARWTHFDLGNRSG